MSIEVESTVNPYKKNAKSRQGFGLNAKERRAVEIQAMNVVRDFLEKQGYVVENMSSNHSYDYLVKKGDSEIKVEVKGTTSFNPDAILMTANEVSLHLDDEETTALAIVSEISFRKRGNQPECTGGRLEYLDPSPIKNWLVQPTAFIVKRP